MTRYQLGDIQPNPFRNIKRYEIRREKIESLKGSISRTDFWDNLVARIGSDGKPQIGYGHHRLVALREMFPPDHEIDLIVRDLDDTAMLHVMADENMQEWASTGTVIVETVRAVRDFLAVSGPARKLGHGAKPNSGEEIAAFLGIGWTLSRVEDALSIINAEDKGILEPDDIDGLGIEQATVMRQHVARIEDPKVRREAIREVRQNLKSGVIGKRQIGALVANTAAKHGPRKYPVPALIAKGVWSDIDNFWRVGIDLPDGKRHNREEVVRLIAQNRDAVELAGVSLPWAEQLARALERMADTATTLVAVLRSDAVMEVE